jgi:hypothetical protein
MMLAGALSAATMESERRWARTPEGWRRVGWIESRPRFDAVGLHPWVVAAGQLTLSLFALAAFPARVTAAGKSLADRV